MYVHGLSVMRGIKHLARDINKLPNTLRQKIRWAFALMILFGMLSSLGAALYTNALYSELAKCPVVHKESICSEFECPQGNVVHNFSAIQDCYCLLRLVIGNGGNEPIPITILLENDTLESVTENDHGIIGFQSEYTLFFDVNIPAGELMQIHVNGAFVEFVRITIFLNPPLNLVDDYEKSLILKTVMIVLFWVWFGMDMLILIIASYKFPDPNNNQVPKKKFRPLTKLPFTKLH
jgi:hypothetical protein